MSCRRCDPAATVRKAEPHPLGQPLLVPDELPQQQPRIPYRPQSFRVGFQREIRPVATYLAPP